MAVPQDAEEVENQLFTQASNLETEEIEISISPSSLDTTSIYKIQVNNIDDFSGETIEEIGFSNYKMKNQIQ